MISTDFRLWAKVQEGRGSPCMLRNLIAMGAESELMSQEENINISAGWDFSPQGYRGQRKDFQDWEICKGNQ